MLTVTCVRLAPETHYSTMRVDGLMRPHDGWRTGGRSHWRVLVPLLDKFFDVLPIPAITDFAYVGLIFGYTVDARCLQSCHLLICVFVCFFWWEGEINPFTLGVCKLRLWHITLGGKLCKTSRRDVLPALIAQLLFMTETSIWCHFEAEGLYFKNYMFRKSNIWKI